MADAGCMESHYPAGNSFLVLPATRAGRIGAKFAYEATSVYEGIAIDDSCRANARSHRFTEAHATAVTK